VTTPLAIGGSQKSAIGGASRPLLKWSSRDHCAATHEEDRKDEYVIEGTNGLAHALGKSIEIEWKNVKLDCFDRLALKTYNTPIPAQSGVFCTIALHKVHPFNPADIVSVEAEVFQDAYDFTGGGRFGPKHDVHTKEDADHSLPYLMAVALLDGDVQPAQLEPSRIKKKDVQDLMQKVTVRPYAGLTARYPASLASRVTVRPKSGTSFTQEISDFPGPLHGHSPGRRSTRNSTRWSRRT
jgi:2-methylcitrate dehydratase